MISYDCIVAYRNQYPNDGWCGYGMPDGNVVITDDKEERSVTEPYDKEETDEIFMDRLERSKKTEKNLFFEEWKPFKYEEDCEY